MVLNMENNIKCLQTLSIEYYKKFDDGTIYIDRIKHISCHLEYGHTGMHMYDDGKGKKYWW